MRTKDLEKPPSIFMALVYALRYPLYAALVVLVLGVGVQTYLRVQKTYELESAVTILIAKNIHQEQELDAFKQQMKDTITDMRITIYGPMTEAKRKPLVVETWSENRDRELRERLHQLELWRLRSAK